MVDRKAAVLFGVLTRRPGCSSSLLAPQSGDTTFRLATAADFVQLPEITVPSTATAWVFVVVCALCTAAVGPPATRGSATRRCGW